MVWLLDIGYSFQVSYYTHLVIYSKILFIYFSDSLVNTDEVVVILKAFYYTSWNYLF